MTHSTQHEGLTRYEKPEIADYGTLTTLTASTAFRGPEDGATKLDPVPHHSGPTP